MATIESTTDTQQFKLDTTTQEFQVMNTILERYQRMEQALTDCWVGPDNHLCLETHNLVGDILAEVGTELL